MRPYSFYSSRIPISESKHFLHFRRQFEPHNCEMATDTHLVCFWYVQDQKIVESKNLPFEFNMNITAKKIKQKPKNTEKIFACITTQESSKYPRISVRTFICPLKDYSFFCFVRQNCNTQSLLDYTTCLLSEEPSYDLHIRHRIIISLCMYLYLIYLPLIDILYYRFVLYWLVLVLIETIDANSNYW